MPYSLRLREYSVVCNTTYVWAVLRRYRGTIEISRPPAVDIGVFDGFDGFDGVGGYCWIVMNILTSWVRNVYF